MPLFQITTTKGKSFQVRARSFIKARAEAKYHLDLGDWVDGIKTIPEEKQRPPSGYELIEDAVKNDKLISEKMDDIEKSYINYWIERRKFWMAKTDADLNEIFPNRYNSRAYYRSEYYQLEIEGGLTNSVSIYDLWLQRIKYQAVKAKRASIQNLIRAIAKVTKGQPITYFRVYNIRKGKAGLEGMIQVNDITKRFFAIYAEGPVQRLHIRYLIK